MSLSPPIRESRERRFRLLSRLAIAGFGLVVLGLMRLQVVEHDKYLELANENRVRLEVLRAPRGVIYDASGDLLADSVPSFEIVFRPFPAESAQRARDVLSPAWMKQVAALVEADTAVIRRAVATANRSGQTAMLRADAPFRVLAAVEESRAELPGIEVQIEPLRHYPHGKLAAHLLGYAGEVTDQELDSLSASGYRLGDLIGRTGIERNYEEILRGRDGAEYVVVNAMGKRVSTLTEQAPRPPVGGHDIVLTLDLKVQNAMEQAMANVERGAAVAIDPRDGAILGMVSRPAFDPNEFSHGMSWDRWNELSSGGSNPLLNRAIQGAYPPGSTFKVVVMLAALRAGVAGPHTWLQPCTGSYYYGGRVFNCWKWEGHGALDFIGALQNSCDAYFYQIGPLLTLPRLAAAAREFGLGARTGVDLPQERRGLIPDAAWYDQQWGPGRWRKGMMLNLAIGQGELLVTPIQLAMVAAQVANGGRAIRPHVVEVVRGESEFAPDRPTRAGVTADAESWATVRMAMEKVVSDGTGQGAKVPGIRVAGKTGTSQNTHGKDHSLFICYAPADSPRVALAVVAENRGHGGTVAAPIAARVLTRILLPDSLQNRVVVRPVPPDTTGGTVGD
ncbi:MAG: penicillin-binding protein 2 [Candidatus Eisenbacteria bacterium]|uniref:Penicillin-binding protein 2 n=1 Tax=Eiseniibacteriota bacterium TaxID=2212470 RepID=A0A538SWB1_UNCEI|nr:MAG: penicillin-binding protein 2 [Candidatus Eisenbacteria bacterium]